MNTIPGIYQIIDKTVSFKLHLTVKRSHEQSSKSINKNIHILHKIKANVTIYISDIVRVIIAVS